MRADMRASASSDPQSLAERPQWRALTEHRGQIGRRHLRELFAADPSRGERLVAEGAGLYLDYSKNRVTDETLRAFAEHGELKGVMAEDGGDAEAVLASFAKAGIDTGALAIQLQRDGAQAFAKSWKELMTRIADKSDALAHAG